jgi:hypothetical protein
VLCPTATELREVELMLSAAAATGVASPGNDEQPTTASTSSTPLPASASIACKLISEETTTKSEDLNQPPHVMDFWLPTQNQITSLGQWERDVRITSAPDLGKILRPSASAAQAWLANSPGTRSPRSSLVMNRLHMQYHLPIDV